MGDEQRVTMMDDVGKGGGQDTRRRREHNQERVNHAWRLAPQRLVRYYDADLAPQEWLNNCQGILHTEKFQCLILGTQRSPKNSSDMSPHAFSDLTWFPQDYLPHNQPHASMSLLSSGIYRT